MELSKRLQAVADFVTPGSVIADVGTDHGYIPIYLVEAGIVDRAIAMDINKGPLERADAHIRLHKLQEHISTRLSDGVAQLHVGECDCVIIAGMGGGLVMKIMEEGEAVFRSLRSFVLQPQSELEKVRHFLVDNGYRIIAENMVLDEGKYYPMMQVVSAEPESYDEVEYRYGKYLLQEKNLVLKQFLEKEVALKRHIMKQLQQENGAHIQHRINELQSEIDMAMKALQVYL